MSDPNEPTLKQARINLAVMEATEKGLDAAVKGKIKLVSKAKVQLTEAEAKKELFGPVYRAQVEHWAREVDRLDPAKLGV